ncbi:GGDEF domain-containing protein [Roseateles oligotrophus]|uniref:diguanylate cyclase n=1 Tax=Roseateles oligotrophus TaxID=1769250 RepID=A0ABT2YK54_9BURK|nr:GGDEF domain-containing protein [Roseateles oligotrophus]MCV2370436.1 GGDEF domain-containing protein [Roseateles oligotrophus]
MQRIQATRWEAEAHHDALTGLPNRRYMSSRLPDLWAHLKTTQRPLLAAMLDLDHFKKINDVFGHEIGDAVLRQVGSLLLAHVRSRDLPIRLGGEEFIVLMPDASPEQALVACERIRREIETHDWPAVTAGLHVTVSIGIAPMDDTETPWAQADTALYRAKAQGRNCVVCADSPPQRGLQCDPQVQS